MTSSPEEPALYTTPSPINQAGLYTCPVCGWAGLARAPYNQFGNPDFAICPCCGVEYGYDDSDGDHARLRSEWIGGGMRWWAKSRTPPPAWDPTSQLRDAGF